MTSILATITASHQLAAHLATHAASATAPTSIGHLQAAVLGLLQGVTELFPISSLGHTIILPKLVGWNIDQSADSFLPFVVTLHVGTALALLVFYWRTWVVILTPMLASIRRGSMGTSPEERLGWLVCAGTIIPAIVAVFLEKEVKTLFASPEIAAGFLIANGFVLFLGERLRLRARAAYAASADGAAGELLEGRTPRPLSTLSWREAIIIGASQVLAFLPGISRSGATMVTALATGLTHEAALRFSFLLATPIILAAGIAEMPSLFDPKYSGILGDALFGGLLAGIAAYLSVRFLTRYFSEAKNRLDPYAYYCWIAGCLALIGLAIRG